MSKSPSDNLYRLIKSLSASEKRYFKVATKGTELKEPLYLALFDLMDGAIQFDDAVFQRKLYGKLPAADSKKYTVLKAYLYELVLRSLQSYDDKNSVIYQINGLLQSVAVLFKRGLYGDCEPLLLKAERIATRYECFSYLLEIMDWRKQLAYTRADIDYLNKELQHIHQKEQDTLALQTDMLTSKQAFFNILLQVRRDAQAQKSADIAPIDLVHAPQFDPQTHSVKAEIYRLRTRNLMYYAQQNPESFWRSGADLLEFIEAHPHFLKESLTEYIAALSNYILASGLVNDYAAVEATLLKLRNLTPNTLDDRMKIHRQYYSNRFALSVFSGAFEEGKVHIEQHKREIEELGIGKYESDTTLVQYFLIYFGCGAYDQALEYLNEWINQPRTVSRLDIQSVVRMLNLIIHYEQGNLFLLEYKLRGTERYLRSRKQEYILERLFIKLISDLIKTDQAAVRRKRCEEAKKELLLIQDQPIVRTILKTFDFDAWLECKINGSSFAAVVQDKFKNLGSLHQ
jgi:hypothetical protein